MSKSKFIIHKDTHPELPAYVWMAVDEAFMSPETVTNISPETFNKTVEARYMTIDEIDPDFYKKINVETNEKTEDSEMPEV